LPAGFISLAGFLLTLKVFYKFSKQVEKKWNMDDTDGKDLHGKKFVFLE